MRLKIAVCDDEHAAVDYISQAIKEELERMNISCAIECFTRAKDLLEALKAGTMYQVLFLDIEMPFVSGIEIGSYINSHYGEQSKIIYITNSLEKVFHVFSTRPLRYIRKQYFYEELPEALGAVQEHFQKQAQEMLSFETEKGTISISQKSVLYVQAENKEQLLVTDAGTYRMLTSMSKLEALLTGKNFVRCHRSYLVNAKRIFLIQKDSLLLDDHTEIPLSKGSRRQVKEVLLNLID